MGLRGTIAAPRFQAASWAMANWGLFWREGATRSPWETPMRAKMVARREERWSSSAKEMERSKYWIARACGVARTWERKESRRVVSGMGKVRGVR